MKVENWNGHAIRFVERNGEWWAVLKDVCDALGLQANLTARRLDNGVLSKHTLAPQPLLAGYLNRKDVTA